MKIMAATKMVEIKDEYSNFSATFRADDKIGIHNFGLYCYRPKVIKEYEIVEEKNVNIFQYLFRNIINERNQK